MDMEFLVTPLQSKLKELCKPLYFLLDELLLYTCYLMLVCLHVDCSNNVIVDSSIPAPVLMPHAYRVSCKQYIIIKIVKPFRRA